MRGMTGMRTRISVPDAPDKLVGEDYKGALGEGDQGGFVMLTFDLSDNHSTIDGYRIWRDVTVTQDVGRGR